MKLQSMICMAVLSIALPMNSFAQSPPAASAPADTASAPVATGKRMACQMAMSGYKGQDKRDQMQLCVAQAHMDCLKQAIDQKIVGPQRREFVKTCAQ